MARHIELQNQWKEFSAERARARQAIDEEISEINAKMEELRLRSAELNTTVSQEFRAEWARKKTELQEARDRAVIDELAKGRSAQAILRELGSQNTIWIYKLRARAIAEGRLLEAPNQNSAPVSKEKLNAKQKLDNQMDASEYEEVIWHAGTGPELVGWYISDDMQLIKRERRGGRWFIAGPHNEFLKGDKGFYTLTGDDSITEAANKLMDMVEAKEESNQAS